MQIGLVVRSESEITTEARHAEEAGFDYLASGEHLFFHGPVPNSFINLATAAAVTSHIRLVSTIALLPLYPAAMLAKLAVALDIVSDGRFELGVGAGGEYMPEFDAVGVDPATRFRRMEEGLTVLRKLFLGIEVEFDGEFTRLSGVKIEPPPVQKGGPPIWVAGRRSGAIERAARHADVWFPYMITPEHMASGILQLKETAALAGRAPESVDGALLLWTCVDADGQWARQTGIEEVSRTYSQDFEPLADRYLALGNPDEVADKIQKFALAGATKVIIQIAATPLQRPRVLETLNRHLLPLLRSL